MVKSQEVEALSTLADFDNPGLAGMQVQPERGQGDFRQIASLFGSFSRGTKDDEVISKTSQRSQLLAHCLPHLIENVEGNVGQQR